MRAGAEISKRYNGYEPPKPGAETDDDEFLGWDPYGFHYEKEHRDEELRMYEASYEAYYARAEQVRWRSCFSGGYFSFLLAFSILLALFALCLLR
jgi:hypothetical protein